MMTNRERYKRAFGTLHASDHISLEVNNMKNRNFGKRKFRGRAAAAVIAGVLCIGSITAAAAVLYYNSTVRQEGAYQLNASIERNADEEAQNIRLSGTDIPEYDLEKTEWLYKYRHKDGYEAGKDFTMKLYRINSDFDDALLVYDVSDWEETSLNGHRLLLMKMNGAVGSQAPEPKDAFGIRAVLFDEADGYLLYVFAMNGLGYNGISDILSGISFETCDASEADSAEDIDRLLSPEVDDSDDEIRCWSSDQMVNVGTAVNHDQVEFEIVSAEVYDNISDFTKDTSLYRDSLQNQIADIVDENGNLKSYTREQIVPGDGTDTPRYSVQGSEDIKQRFVYLTIRVKNNGETSDIYVGRTLYYLNEDGTLYDWESYLRPEAVDDFQMDNMGGYFEETDDGQGFYWKNMSAGQEEIYHIGYFVDEDLLDYAYFGITNGSRNSEETDWMIKLN